MTNGKPAPALITILTVLLLALSAYAQQDLVAQQQGGSAIDDAQMILVQPKVTYNAVTNNDLEQLRQYFRGASWEWGVSETAWNWLSKLGVNCFRLINIESDCWKPDPENPGKFTFEPDKRLQDSLNQCKKYNVKPHVILGMRCQTAIAHQKEDGSYWGVKDWDSYEKYCYENYRWMMIDMGFDAIDVEIGNEPDINGIKWITPQRHINGAPQLYDGYFPLYRAWANAAKKFRKDYPDKKLRIGGPPLTLYTFALSDFNWYDRFVHQVKQQNLALDFLSFHYYGNGGAILNRDHFGPFLNFTDHVQYLRELLRKEGLTHVTLHMTEWGPSWITDGDNPNGVINNNHVGAAFNAAFLTDMLANQLEDGLALVFRNHGQYAKNKPYENNWGWPGYLTRNDKFPTATYNSFDMFCRLPGQRIETSRGYGSIGAVASADNDQKQIGVIVYNFDWDYPNACEGAFPQKVYIQLQQMPYRPSKLNVKRYLIDKDHSDACTLEQRGQELTVDNCILQCVDDFEMTIPQDQRDMVQLPVVTMPPSSVSLWLIEAQE